MRLVRGVQAGREALARGVSRVWEGASPQLLDRTERLFGERLSPEDAVARVVRDVREQGDAALRRYTRLLDGVTLDGLEVPRSHWLLAYRRLAPSVRRALHVVAERVREFHRASMPRTWVDLEQGYGELYTPVERAGVYVPGGAAAYPSTVLMAAVPARVAGVGEVVVASPARGQEGPSPEVLAAAHIAGVDRVFQVGGAQAIAAMAYGTATVPRVDLVCGPGNIFVTLAKRMVFGQVAVDGLYGPTETAVIADDGANPALCAADLLAQAEHDPLASPIFITTSEPLLERVLEQVARQLHRLPRSEAARAALEGQGIAVLVDDLEEAVELANLFAPEHLCLLVREPWALLRRVRSAGGVFLGEYSPEVMGDYVAGPSHVMPTGGTARFGSPLGVHHFLKVSSIVALDREAFARLAPEGVRLARAEGFEGHARAMALRLGPGGRRVRRPRVADGEAR